MSNDEILKALLNVSHSLLSPQVRRPGTFPTPDNGRQMEKGYNQLKFLFFVEDGDPADLIGEQMDPS